MLFQESMSYSRGKISLLATNIISQNWSNTSNNSGRYIYVLTKQVYNEFHILRHIRLKSIVNVRWMGHVI